MQFTYSNTNNYLAGAKEVNDISTNIYNTARQTGVDVNKLIQTERQARATKKLSKDKATETIGKKSVNVQRDVKLLDMDSKLRKDVRNINRPAKMAGALAATVDTGNAYLMYDKERKLKLKEDADEKAYRQKQIDLLTKGFKSTEAMGVNYIQRLEQKLKEAREGNTTQTISSNSTTLPVQAIAPSGGNVDRQEVYTYLTKSKGLSKNKALGLMANIDRESTFRSNPAGGDGGNSFGMLQWNNNYGRSDLMKKNVPDYATNWKGQLDHALSQNQLPEYNKFIKKFKDTTFDSPQAAGEAFLRNWEKPADVPGGIAKNNQFIAGYNYQ